ncbi:MAG: bestrophin family protein [Azonexus sp.]
MIVRPNYHWFRLLFVWRGSVLPEIVGRLALIGIVSVISVLCRGWWMRHYPDSALSIPPFTLMGIALAIFLGFRNSVSYERFWEARKQWGMLLIAARNLTGKLVAVLPGDAAAALRERVARDLAAFAYALKHQLRATDPRADLKARLDPATLAVASGKCFPAQAILLALGGRLAEARRTGHLADIEWLALAKNVDQLGEVAGASERIANTPMPYTYRVLMNRTVVAYCLLLPIGLTSTLGWLTPLIATFVAYTFLALETVGEQLEEPFGTEANDLALDALCHNIECATCELAGLQPLGQGPVACDFVLT